jgi:ATP-binding cassette subfamily C protein CydC
MSRHPNLDLLRIARPMWPRLLLAAAAGVATAGVAIALTATSAWLISRASQRPPILDLMVAIVLVRAFGLSRGLLRYGERLAGHDAALRVLTELRVRLYARLSRTVPAGGPDLRDGDLVGRLVADVDAALDALVRAILPIGIGLTVAAGAAAVLIVIEPAAGTAVGIAIMLAVALAWIGPAVTSGRAERRGADIAGRMTADWVTSMQAMPELVAYQATGPVLARLIANDRALWRDRRRTMYGLATTGAGWIAAIGASAVAALYLGADAVAGHRLDPVMLAVLVLTPLALGEAIAGLPAATSAMRTGSAALERIFAVLDQPDPMPDPATTAPTPNAPIHVRATGLRGGWPGGDELGGVDLDLPPGEKVAIIGPSGAGKSTLALVLARLLPITGGDLTFNDVPAAQLSGRQVRDVVGLIDDRCYLFDASIADNLRLAKPDATDAELRDALARVRLSDWVDSLPDGLATKVGERGSAVSGGQQRRLAMARALLHQWPVIVLDEPTEHLDSVTAAAVTADLLAAAGDRTVVLITHRPFGLGQVDRVVRMGREGRTALVADAAGLLPA